MTDDMFDPREETAEILAERLGLERARVREMLETPRDLSFGDLAFPCFALAKVMRRNPQEIAGELAGGVEEKGRAAGFVERAEARGAYVNVTFDVGATFPALLEGVRDGAFFEAVARSGEGRRVMVEHSQPNTHKTFHVGHLRNVCIGDCLVRVLRHNGHDVIAANYIGDTGAHVAKWIWYMLESGETLPEHDRVAWIGRLYEEATATIEEAPDGERERLKKRVAEVQRRLEGGDEELTQVWRWTREVCLAEFSRIYEWLGVEFDTVFYESEVEQTGKEVVERNLERGVFERSEGAVIADLEDRDLGAFLVLKSDGSTLYSTKDLALATRKFDEWSIQDSCYVVASEQSYYFRQLFATLELMGYENARDCRHVSYELVVLPSGKMSSRRGNVVPFDELKGRIVARVVDDYMGGHEGWSAEHRRETAERIAVAALKYGMLSQDNNKTVVFDLDRWLEVEGDTGVYLLYSYVRMAGIFRKAGGHEPAAADGSRLTHETERELVTRLYGYHAVMRGVERSLDPSRLAHYLRDLAKAFSRFYHACPVISEDRELMDARLALVSCVQRVMCRGLELMGIETVEEM
jgi:arginyl-tRNA synthetase